MSRSSLLSRVYFALAIVGLLWSWSYFIEYFRSVATIDLKVFLSFVMSNAASSGVAIDAVMAGIVFSVVVVMNAADDKVKWPWLYILMTFLVGLCVTIPMYFGFRERARVAIEN